MFGRNVEPSTETFDNKIERSMFSIKSKNGGLGREMH
jgi:hypothetical protein